MHVSKVHISPVKWTPWRSPLLQPNFGLKMVIIAFASLIQNTVFFAVVTYNLQRSPPYLEVCQHLLIQNLLSQVIPHL